MTPRKRLFEGYVTKKDLLLGTRGGSTTCPVVRALRRRYPKTDFIISGTHFWRNRVCYVGVPRFLQEFIHDYDHGSKPVKPFKFRVWLTRSTDDGSNQPLPTQTCANA